MPLPGTFAPWKLPRGSYVVPFLDTSGALDEKIPPQTRVVVWFSYFSSAPSNQKGLDLEMGRGSLVFLIRFSYRPGFVMLAVWARLAGFERLQQTCSRTLKHFRNHLHSLYQHPKADGPIFGTAIESLLEHDVQRRLQGCCRARHSGSCLLWDPLKQENQTLGVSYPPLLRNTVSVK